MSKKRCNLEAPERRSTQKKKIKLNITQQTDDADGLPREVFSSLLSVLKVIKTYLDIAYMFFDPSFSELQLQITKKPKEFFNISADLCKIITPLRIKHNLLTSFRPEFREQNNLQQLSNASLEDLIWITESHRGLIDTWTHRMKEGPSEIAVRYTKATVVNYTRSFSASKYSA